MVSPRLSVHFRPGVITLVSEGDVRIALTLHPARCFGSLLWVLPSPQRLVGSIREAGLPPIGLPGLGLCCPYVLQDTENSRHWSNMKSLRQNNK